MSRFSYLCLAGPTASGKTAAALAIATAWQNTRPVEIVSVDSALVYRGMDIGTAKPSAAERAQVPHHLIDLIEPSEAYSAARFVTDAQRLIAEITARGHLPLLVGGTMLYFKALFDGLDAMPAADRGVRTALAEQLERDGLSALYRELQRVDAVTAARLKPADQQRIQRALEVYRVSGQPLSSFHTEKVALAHAPLISLEPDDRAWLHARIEQRFHQMLDAGLVDEVRTLGERGDLDADMPSMRCVGYRQTWEALVAGDLSDLPERGVAATRQLAKRQLTWLRSLPQRHRVACDAADATDSVVMLASRLAADLVRA
ncbi:tRNA (adenosine(37)-N6)-dimethylallyltransferase MiaA [Rhizobacter sp. Root404]|uniref:tRNA (adenosine(37)-N6)-dimethylallyltransferase MiaA n=1 Tax=Rhizobacter sp. Root404 TaxID=1736528 RepID=UPI0006FFD6A5|nr:tRNA (adenosine(37)-N6)-dimethylallyltransferase MiaA [Rhizobacter sp. Root404]KQW36087.1 tRNA dimethylallyltransferase [Rhizobacter sp. Root404]